ncbi:nucleotidyltransferase [Pseudonocardia sp. KRD-182]|uniref:nucleotidyltransferase domain-containing protein n=1 Tax=Pseudonocardia oceani TaxID=2792013 RepID=UPI001C4A0E0A|nr:nucleotidyltransferase [Pseudonocardia oceani]MBW0110345.1 nucleotidyltransferase [Pseudonocardia oceani]
MTRTVNKAFQELDTNLNLDRLVRFQAQELHNAIRDGLTAAGRIAGSFLQGSFARKTMLKPLKDVDIVCLLHDHLWEEFCSAVGPGKVMESFKLPIEEWRPGVQFDVGDEPAGKALRVTLPDVEFTFDLVPAFEQDDDYVLIGDRFEGAWMTSNTRIQLKRVSDRNQAIGGRFVHQVRQAKQLTKHYDDLGFVTGIVVESLAYAAIDRGMTDKAAITQFLEHARAAVNGPILEPAGEDDVTAKWTNEDRETAARVYAKAYSQATEALELEAAGDTDASIDVWHSLFGDAFPPAAPRSAQKALTALAAGSVTSTGRPTTTQVGRQLAAPGRSWSPGLRTSAGRGTVSRRPGKWRSH